MAESDIFVRFGANIGPLVDGIDQATGKLGKFGNDSKKVAKDVAKIAAAGLAASAALVAMASNSAKSAREIRSLSKVAGISTKEFQNIAFATKGYGIEQEKLADILKDTQDKIGDFLATGAGPMADFFENIAPKVGVTADQFKELSGKDALQLYTSSLEDANLSQAEMIFYMEALASDSALLLPLLKNNGEELGRLAKRADELGAALSDQDISALDSMQIALDASSKSAAGLTDQFSVALAPIIEDLIELFQETSGEMGGFKDIANDTVEAVIRGFGYLGNAIRGVEIIVNGLEVAFLGLKAGSLGVISTIAEYLDELVMGFTSSINELIGLANNIPGVDMALLVSGGSEMVDGIKQSAIEANVALQESMAELHNKMMQPLPTELVDAYIESLGHERIIESEIIKNEKLAEIDRQAKQDELERERNSRGALAQLTDGWGDNQTKASSKMFGDLATLQESGNKRMFEIGKKAALAQTVMKTYQGAQEAFTAFAGAGLGPAGVALGIAAAGAAVVAGGIRAQAIQSTTFGGGGGTKSAGAGGGASPAAPAAMPEQRRTVSVQSLDPNSLVSGSMVNSIAEQLVELQNDGFKLVV
jgi:hypothetical protein